MANLPRDPDIFGDETVGQKLFSNDELEDMGGDLDSYGKAIFEVASSKGLKLVSREADEGIYITWKPGTWWDGKDEVQSEGTNAVE